MLVVFFVWEVEGFCVFFGSDLECCCLLSVHQRQADPVDNFTVRLVTIKCLGIVVLSMATQYWISSGKQSQFRIRAVIIPFSFVKKKKKILKTKNRHLCP